jgi:hypothetical protein
MYSGWSSPRNFSTRAMSTSSQFLPHASAAGLAGITKKMTYVTAVTAMKRTTAHKVRRIRNVSTA